MSFEKVQRIPSKEEILSLVPLSEELKNMKNARDKEIKDIIEGKDNRFLAIVGPCSADDEDAVCEYVYNLARIQDKIKDKIFIIPRIYTNKPRTTGEGYKGMLHQPNPEEAPDMLNGILTIRKLHVRAMTESGLTASDEMLYPDNLIYFEDMLSYIAIGARSTENQQHRLTASGIGLPVGMKNPMSGDLNVMFNSIQAAQLSHNFIYRGYEVESSGNNFAHAILRGSVNKHGESIPNYHYEDLILSCEMYEKKGFSNPFIIVDTNHSNSGKKFKEQPRIAKDILYSRNHNSLIKKMVRGLLIESYLEEGSQKINERIYGKSITDPCLGMKDTENLLYYLADNLV